MGVSNLHGEAAPGVEGGFAPLTSGLLIPNIYLNHSDIQTFTPTWTVVSGTDPTLGNGTLTGHYQQVASNLYWIAIALTLGSTTTIGSGQYVFGAFPFTAKSTDPVYQVVPGILRDAGTASYILQGRVAAGSTGFGVIAVNDGINALRHFTHGDPITPVSGDQLAFTGILATD